MDARSAEVGWEGVDGFARRVERVRLTMGYDVEGFADACAIEPGQVRDWEGGVAPADRRVREEILGALCCLDRKRLADILADARPRTLH